MHATPEELRARTAWVEDTLLAAVPPFTFNYDGRASATLLPSWPRAIQTVALDAARTQHTLVWTDPATGLQVRCVAVTYADHPVVEWTVNLKNTGAAATPILEQIQGLDARLQREGAGEFVLHHQRGDYNAPDSYQPCEVPLWPNMRLSLAPSGGRPSNSAFPYYNLQMPGGGVMLAVGWPGQWRTTFERDETTGLRVVAGQEQTHLRLEPGEEVRTPLIALLFWRGVDRIRAHNLWRRWMLAHNLPRCNGQLPKPAYSFCSGGFFEGLKVSAASEKLFLDVLTREGIALDYWWMDAGWYPCDQWPKVGSWTPDPERFPAGLKAVSDYAHARGAKLIVWFEPERVSTGTWLYEQHPEWLILPPATGVGWPGQTLFDLGNADARAWLIEHVDGLIREQGIDVYRQDHNYDPLPYWRGHDAEDRQGCTENHCVCGYLAYWDALRERHPNLLIDSCAGGGRRNDLETLRRAVPLLRSDYQSFAGDPVTALGNQCHTYALSLWVPYYGQGAYYDPDRTVDEVAYVARSYTSPSFTLAVDVRREGIDWDLYRQLLAEWRQVAPSLLGDYYPLTPYSLREDAWIAWQFHRADDDAGALQAFRRGAAVEPTCALRLQGLDPHAVYTLTDLVSGRQWRMNGEALATTGLPVEIAEAPGAATIIYARAK